MQVTVACVLRVALLGITSVSRRCGCPACTRAALPALAVGMLNRQQEQLMDARAANGTLNGKVEQLNNTKRQQHDQLGTSSHTADSWWREACAKWRLTTPERSRTFGWPTCYIAL